MSRALLHVWSEQPMPWRATLSMNSFASVARVASSAFQ